MSIEDNKRIVTEAMLHTLNQRLDEAARLYAEDIDWWFPGSGAERSNIRGRDAAIKHASLLKQFFPEGLEVSIDQMTAEGDRVVVEYHYRGRTAGGKIYENYYCSVFTVRNGQVAAISEHVDTAYAARLLGELPRGGEGSRKKENAE